MIPFSHFEDQKKWDFDLFYQLPFEIDPEPEPEPEPGAGTEAENFLRVGAGAAEKWNGSATLLFTGS